MDMSLLSVSVAFVLVSIPFIMSGLGYMGSFLMPFAKCTVLCYLWDLLNYFCTYLVIILLLCSFRVASCLVMLCPMSVGIWSFVPEVMFILEFCSVCGDLMSSYLVWV